MSQRSYNWIGRMDLRVGGVKYRAAYDAKKSFLAIKFSEYFSLDIMETKFWGPVTSWN